jgi:hypothetical protein
VRTFFLYCQTGRNLYNWQHSKADWGGRWTCVLFDPKTKGLNPLWQWILLFLGHPQWVILFSSWVVFEYFGSNPASDLQTKTLVLHLVSDKLCDLSTSYPQPYTQHSHRVIHSIFCNSEILDRNAVILFGYLPFLGFHV